MNTTILEGAQDLKVRFHIGRGGHFNNAGHKTYVGTVNGLSDCFGESSIIDVDDNSDKLPDSKWQLIDGGGNVILTGRDKIESETGILDWDGEYDTDIVRKLSECDDDEYEMILDTEERGAYVEKNVLAYVCSALGKLMATNIKVYPSNMEVFTQDDCVHLERDNFSVYTKDEEDDVRELLADKGFISESIDEIIVKMEMYDWFSEKEEMTVENYDFSCDSFLSSQAGFLKEVGDEGEHEDEAKEILGMECGENDSEAWADIMFSTSTGKQYAVCGTAAATAPEGVFYYKELDAMQYIECHDKYLDEFGANAEECLDYLDEDDVELNEGKITFKGNDPVVIDDCDTITHCEDLFEAFYTACRDIQIAAYLVGCRHFYCFQEAACYWR